MTKGAKQKYHRLEAVRIQKELDSIGDMFKDAGIVKTILRKRVEQEKERGQTKGP